MHRWGLKGCGGILLLALFLGWLVGCVPLRPPAEAPRGLQAADLAPIAAIVEEQIRAGNIPGAVVLIGHQDRVVYRRAFGERTRAPQRQPMTEDTIFDLASLTKVVATTTAVLQLVERGRLGLDQPVARYWPEFAANGKGTITVRQLLTHQSGLRADLDLKKDWSGYETALAMIATDRPLAAAGTRYLYSDVNFEILGELVRRVSGLPLDAYCAEHIFAPLGMRDTGFRPAPGDDRLAPTGYGRPGQVHDPSAARMGGVAGHAGLFSSADDLARFAQMLLGGGSAKGVRILQPATVAALRAPHSLPGQAKQRGLGWELGFPVALVRQAPLGSFGHTGFTGTLLWLDPASRTYVIVLSNRVYPDGKGDARPLRQQILALVADALAAAPAIARTNEPAGRVASGADVLAADGFAPLRGLRIGLITNHTGRDAAGNRLIDLLHGAPEVQLAALFSPEHGLRGQADEQVASGHDPQTELPVHSLYGAVRRPTEPMLEGLDALVFDIQDAGARFYTYSSTMAYAMEAAAHKGIAFYVLDRPNPITAERVQGPVMDADLRSFTGYFPLPVRHGMTMGELARLFNGENRIGVRLQVIGMRGYRRAAWYDETGLPWVGPSPNLRTLTQATLYPGVALVEGANLSVGRGTDSPFELLGAPWIDGGRLAAYLNGRGIPGVRFEAADFVPRENRYGQQLCHGVRIVLVDRETLDAPALGVEIASALQRLYPTQFELDKTLGMIGARWVVQAIKDGQDPREIAQRWQGRLAAFRALRAKYLLY